MQEGRPGSLCMFVHTSRRINPVVWTNQSNPSTFQSLHVKPRFLQYGFRTVTVLFIITARQKGYVFSCVCLSFCSRGGRRSACHHYLCYHWSVTVHMGPPSLPRTCSNLFIISICWHAGSWHSTEMYSCLIEEFQCLKQKWLELNICDF